MGTSLTYRDNYFSAYSLPLLEIMKKLIVLGTIFMSTVAMNAQSFEVGNKKADLTVGVGVVDFGKVRATFDQHFNMEWGITNVADKFTLGVGFAVNNAYGAKHESAALGSYDYEYTRIVSTREKNSNNRWVTSSDRDEIRRKGNGAASCDEAIEDLNAMATVSLHYSPKSGLDTYAKIGVGAGVKTSVLSNFHDEVGFAEINYEHTSEGKTKEITTRYSFKDIDHVSWEGKSAKIAPAFAIYLGATYYINSIWGIDAQLGLVSSNIKVSDTGNPSSYSIVAIGASYKF